MPDDPYAGGAADKVHAIQQPVAAEEPSLPALDNAGPESGSSPIAGALGPEGGLTHVPFFSDASSMAMASLDPAASTPPSFDHPMWFGGGGGGIGGGGGASGGGGGGGMSPYLGSSTDTPGPSMVAPSGGSERNDDGGPSGGGPNGGGPNGGSPRGGGPNGGGPNGSGPGDGDGDSGGGDGGGGGGGGNEEPPIYVPPTIADEVVTTTTGDSETTTGDVVHDTTGSGDNDNDGDVPSVPEPATLVLLGVSACGAAARALRGRR